MALISKIRENTRLLVIVVSLGLLFFITRELLGTTSLVSNRTPIIGVVAGRKITLKEYQAQVDNLQRSFFLNYEQTPSEEELSFLRKQAWKQLLDEIIYTKECNTLGIEVTDDELVDMVQGEHIHPDLQAAFINPETREFSKEDLLAYLQNLSRLPAANQRHWYHIERNLAYTRCQDKFKQLVGKSIYVTSLEAEHQYNINHTLLDLQYFYIPYYSIPDEEITITDAMLKRYLQEHAHEYQVEETKDIRYVTFPIVASQKDRLAFENELETLKQDFIRTEEDSLFASLHTDANPHLVYLECTEKDLPPPILEQKEKLKKGSVIGPVIQDEKNYKFYKVTKLIAGNPTKYELTIIEKSLLPGDETKEIAFRQADEFVKKVNNAARFDMQIAKDSLQAEEAKVGKYDTHIGNLYHARELVRWLYKEAKVGSASPIFELDNAYVVVAVVGHTKAGTAPLEKVYEEIRPKVINEQKAKIISQKLQPMLHLPLDSLATQYGQVAKVYTAQQIKFNNASLPGIGLAKHAISQAFALQSGTRSKVIADRYGVVILEVMERQMPTLPDSWLSSQLEQVQQIQNKQSYQLSKALEHLAQTKDYRYKYY